jgi:hypothetical protein
MDYGAASTSLISQEKVPPAVDAGRQAIDEVGSCIDGLAPVSR